jgi:hypothetical protein
MITRVSYRKIILRSSEVGPCNRLYVNGDIKVDNSVPTARSSDPTTIAAWSVCRHRVWGESALGEGFDESAKIELLESFLDG